MGDESIRRLAENEVLFRVINENIEVLAQRLGGPALWEFVCECSRRDCADLIRLTVEEYEAVRSVGDRFALVPGHEVDEIERVVERADGYLIVEKIGQGREIARGHDPRGSSSA
jgi:hypothetical protein